MPFASRIANLSRECLPHVTIIMGGLHPSISPLKTLQSGDVDYVVIGEGEKILVNLLSAIDENSLPSQITGLAGFIKGEKFINPELDLPQNLDGIPHPARDLLNMRAYLSQNMMLYGRNKARQTPVITSRGCPQDCTFCSVRKQSGRRWRGRSAENVLEEIEMLIDEYNIESIAFFDDNVAFHQRRMKDICTGILERNMKISWIAPNGISVKALDRETIKLMKESGCSMLNLAIESGDEYILNSVIKKKLSLDKVREVAEICHQMKIPINGYFVIGMPGDTENSIQRSLDFARSTPLRDVGVFIATPFPGTELYDTCIENKYLDAKLVENAFNGEPDSSVFHKAMIETPVLTKKRVEFWQTEFHRLFWRERFRKNPLLFFRLLVGKTLRNLKSMRSRILNFFSK